MKKFLFYFKISILGFVFVNFINAENVDSANIKLNEGVTIFNYTDSSTLGNISEMIEQAYLLFDSAYPNIYYFEYYHEHWDYIRKKKFVFTNMVNNICLIAGSNSEQGDTLSNLKLSKYGKQYYTSLCDSIKAIPKPKVSIQDDYINVVELNENRELIFSNSIIPNLELISKIFENE